MSRLEIRNVALEYPGQNNGNLVQALADLNLDAMREKVAFYQADACNLKELYTGYDLILAANLIDRLYDPHKFLAMIHERVNPGGLLVIASPYSWDQTITEKEKWLCIRSFKGIATRNWGRGGLG